MTYEGDAGRASSGGDAEVVEAAQVDGEVAEDRRETRPGWLNRFVWDTLWKVVAVGFVVAVGLVIGSRVQDLLVLLVISMFFALAIIPAVKYMHEHWGWRRGAAVGAIYAGLILFVVLMILLLIPAIAEFAEEIGDSGGEGIEELNGAGVYYGATLTEAANYRDRPMFVVGGANSAGQAAMHFSRSPDIAWAVSAMMEPV